MLWSEGEIGEAGDGDPQAASPPQELSSATAPPVAFAERASGHGHRSPATWDRNPPLLHNRGGPSLRGGGVGAPRRSHHQLPRRFGGLRAAGSGGAGLLERQRN